MATFVDGLIGYEYFMETRAKASIEDVNKFLERENRGPIAKRTFNHYRSLWRYGFRSYFPINQFDVTRTLGRLPVAPDRRRYDREKLKIKAEISVDGKSWLSAKTDNKSLVGLGMYALKEIPIKEEEPFWIRMDQYHDIPMILVWKKWEKKQLKFGARAIEFISKYRILHQKMLIDENTGVLIVKKTSEGELHWEQIYNLMGKVEKLIDASSELIKYLAKLTRHDVKITPSVLSSIKFSSPGEISLIIDWKIIALIVILIRVIQLWKLEKDHLREETRALKLANDMREIQVEFARKTIKSKKVKELEILNQVMVALPEWIKKVFNIKEVPSNLFEAESLEKAMTKEQLLPVAADLIAGDDPEIKVEVDKNPSKDPEDQD